MRHGLTLALVVAVGLAVPSHAGEPAAKQFPVGRTQIVKGGLFLVDGRVRIPAGVEITVQKDTKILGKAGSSILEVEGKLTVQGIRDFAVVIEGVTIEVQPKFGEVNLTEVEFRGEAKAVGTRDDFAAEGKIRINAASFGPGAAVDVQMCGASLVDIRQSTYQAEFAVKAVSADGAATNSVKLFVKACRAAGQGWPTAIRAEGLTSVEIRESQIGGETSTFKDCASISIDSCYLFSKKVEFVQSVSGRCGRMQVQSCDIHAGTISLSAPAMTKGDPERMKLENCWFAGETSVRSIRDKLISDHDDDPKNGVVAGVERVSAKPLQLCWTIYR